MATAPATVPPATVAPAPGVRARFDFEAIGTHWQIETPDALPAAVVSAVLARIETFDAVYSRFRADSLVSAVARTGGRFEFPQDSVALFDLYDRLVAATDGAVDPLVGRDLELLGYDAAYTLKPAVPGRAGRAGGAGGAAGSLGTDGRTDAARTTTWTSAVTRQGRILEADGPVVIDVGAAGKGYLVDIVSRLLRRHGLDDFVVDASGDLVHSGADRIRVGLEHPLQPGTAIGVAELSNGALCASASNRRVWGDGLHHILDARTGSPAREVIATWVVVPTPPGASAAGSPWGTPTAVADGLATALFFTGAHRLANTFHFSYVRMYADGRAERSRDFPGELFS